MMIHSVETKHQQPLASSTSGRIAAIMNWAMGLSPSPALAAQLRAQILSEVRAHYAEGGHFLDGDGDVIPDAGDVEVVVEVGGVSTSARIGRTAESMLRKMEARLRAGDAAPGVADFTAMTTEERAREIARGRLRERGVARLPDGTEIAIERVDATTWRAVDP